MHESRALAGTFETVLGGTVLSKIAKTSPWNMHSLKFILAAATGGKLEAYVTTPPTRMGFGESETRGFHGTLKGQPDRI